MAYTFDEQNFRPDAEINSIQKSIDVKGKEGVEIFSAICSGKDLTKYGDKVDRVMTYMKKLGEKAVAGDLKAQAEINAIREIQLETPLLQRLNIFDYIGDFHSVGYNEELRWKVRQLQGKMSGEQAPSGSFAFPTHVWREGPMVTKNITGGLAVDYREEASGNTDAIQKDIEQVITDMLNQMFYDVVSNLYNSIKGIADNDGIAVFYETTGLNQTAVDKALGIIRRWGRVTMSGDYSVVTQLTSFAGFKTDTSGTVQYSEAVMEEVRKTGLLNTYLATPVVEIPNAYNVTRVDQVGGITADNSNYKPYFETYLPEGLLFMSPKMVTGSPLQAGIKGGITSMSGQDINLRLNVQRLDLEFGSIVIPELVPMLGLISDQNFRVDKRMPKVDD